VLRCAHVLCCCDHRYNAVVLCCGAAAEASFRALGLLCTLVWAGATAAATFFMASMLLCCVAAGVASFQALALQSTSVWAGAAAVAAFLTVSMLPCCAAVLLQWLLSEHWPC
jgi:hypothetical protein